MASSCSIGIASLKHSDLNDWLKEIKRASDEARRKNGEPRFIVMGIDYAFATEDDGEIAIVIGDWRD